MLCGSSSPSSSSSSSSFTLGADDALLRFVPFEEGGVVSSPSSLTSTSSCLLCFLLGRLGLLVDFGVAGTTLLLVVRLALDDFALATGLGVADVLPFGGARLNGVLESCCDLFSLSGAGVPAPFAASLELTRLDIFLSRKQETDV